MSRPRNAEKDFVSNIVFLKTGDHLELTKHCEKIQVSMSSIVKIAVMRGLEEKLLPVSLEESREKFQLRLPSDIDEELRKLAEKNGLTKQDLIEFFILTFVLRRKTMD